MEPAFTSCRMAARKGAQAPADEGGAGPSAAAPTQGPLADAAPLPADSTVVPIAGAAEDTAAAAMADADAPAAPADAAGAPAASADTTAVFRLPERLDTRFAVPLAEALQARRGSPLVLDGAAVGFVGALCAEVLLVASRAWQAEGRSFSIARPARAFTEGLQALGLDALIPTEEATG